MVNKFIKIILALALAACLLMATLFSTDVFNASFTPSNYSTHTKILNMEPKVGLTQYGQPYVELDDQNSLSVMTKTSYFLENGFKMKEFLREVHIGDTIEYSIDKELIIFNSANTVRSIKVKGKTYLGLEHLAYKNSFAYKLIVYSVTALMIAGIFYNAYQIIQS